MKKYILTILFTCLIFAKLAMVAGSKHPRTAGKELQAIETQIGQLEEQLSATKGEKNPHQQNQSAQKRTNAFTTANKSHQHKAKRAG